MDRLGLAALTSALALFAGCSGGPPGESATEGPTSGDASGGSASHSSTSVNGSAATDTSGATSSTVALARRVGREFGMNHPADSHLEAHLDRHRVEETLAREALGRADEDLLDQGGAVGEAIEREVGGVGVDLVLRRDGRGGAHPPRDDHLRVPVGGSSTCGALSSPCCANGVRAQEMRNDVTSYDRSNVFARILRGELPSTTLHEDALVKVILDILPVNPGHLLVIPKAEAVLVEELSEEHVAAMFRVAQRMNRALRQSGIPCEGVNLWLSDGKSAGQEIPHVDLHVIPRFPGDGFRFRMGPANRQPLAKERAEELARSLAAVLT